MKFCMVSTTTVQSTDQKPQYARAKHAADYFKISKCTLWNWVHRPGFPRPKRASEKVTLFDHSAIERCINAQSAK